MGLMLVSMLGNFYCLYSHCILSIEYIGDIPAERREEVVKLLNIESERLIKV